MKGSYTIENLPTIVKQAREKSLKGLYKESYDLYRSAMDIIQERIKSCPNSSTREQWLKTGQNIKAEYMELKEILELCQTFKMEKKEEIGQFKNNGNQLILRDYLDHHEPNNGPNYDFNNNRDDYISNKRVESNRERNSSSNVNSENIDKKKFERFGGKVPFEHHNNNNNRNYSDDKKDNDNYLNNKANYNPKPSIPKKSSVPTSNKVSNKMDVDKKRNYEKPWKNNDMDKEKKHKNKEDNKNSNKR
jgi:hypothetical protein